MGVIPGLVATHRVIAPDLPGHGASEVADGPLDAERVLAWLGELIERTCTSPPALVGQMLGGAIAARFASDRGDRLSRLVLVDTLGLSAFQPAPEFGLALTRIHRAADRAHASRISGGTAHSISMACASGWASAGSRSRPTTSIAPARRACRPLCRSHGAVRDARDPAGGPGADRRAHDPDLGAARSRDAAFGRRGRKRPLRLAAARDRELPTTIRPWSSPRRCCARCAPRSAAPDGWSKGGSHDHSGTRTDTRRMGQDRARL